MNIIVYYVLCFIILILIVIGIIYLSYWIPKKFGKKKLGIIISRILILATTLMIVLIAFEDQLFFKSDVRQCLSKQNLVLIDDYEIKNNNFSGISDFYHKFELEISNKDKQRIINKIKSADNYKEEINNSFYLPGLAKNRHEGDTLYANYQTNWQFKKEIYHPNGKGFKPTHLVISISKINNKLTFEKISN